MNSFQVLVQSEAYSTATVLDRIDTFLRDSLTSVQAVARDGSKFGALKESYRSILMQVDYSLSVAAVRMWTEIRSGREQFDYKAQLAKVVNTINGEQLEEFYQRYLLNFGTAKKLVIAVYGKGESPDLGAKFNHNISYTSLRPSDTQYPRTAS